MFQVHKIMEGRYLSILLPGIPTQEIKCTKITDDEIIGSYADGEEIHISQKKVLAYWPDRKRQMRHEKAVIAHRKKATQDSPKSTEKPEGEEADTNTKEQEED